MSPIRVKEGLKFQVWSSQRLLAVDKRGPPLGLASAKTKLTKLRRATVEFINRVGFEKITKLVKGQTT